MDFNIKFFGEIFFGNSFCCYVYGGFVGGRMFIVVIIV